MSPGRMLQVDLLKGIAIVAVVLIHSLSVAQLRAVGARLHIEAAVPVFFLLMAYNAKRSFDRSHSESSLSRIYRSGYVGRRLTRLLIPLGVAVVVSSGIALLRDIPLQFGSRSWLLSMPIPLVGQFFITVSLGFVLLAPCLYAAYRRAPVLTVLLSLASNLLFEIAAAQFAVTTADYFYYQVIPLRFLALFALGMWLADGPELTLTRNRFIFAYALLSIGYLAIAGAHNQVVFVGVEYAYDVVAFGYPLLLVSAGLTWLPAATTAPPLHAIAELGKASYHVFLVQAVWFSSAIAVVSAGDVRWIPASLAICCGLGWLWYSVERRVLSRPRPHASP